MITAATSTWDSPRTHLELAKLTAVRGGFRIARLLGRLRSPRRIIASIFALAFFAVYLLNGIFVLSAREPADPASLMLWLSGGMVFYTLYHLIRCLWSTRVPDLELSGAEELWLSGGPVKRSSLAVYHLSNAAIGAAVKTLLLVVAIACDVEHFELLVVGVFASLLLLEIVRLLVRRWLAGISQSRRLWMRIAVTAIVAAIVAQVITRIMETTPLGSPTSAYLLNGFSAIGAAASSETIKWLSLPWLCFASIVVSPTIGWMTVGKLFLALVEIPVAIALLVETDEWARDAVQRRERQRLEKGQFGISETQERQRMQWSHSFKNVSAWVNRFPSWLRHSLNLIARQFVSVQKYRATILFSFMVPTLLCLSPLVTGQVTEQWFYVVGGIALCTMLLAPPALRIDFRRDLKRMLLLRSLPVKPISMVLGQLTLPILITLVFQWCTIGVAALVTHPGFDQVILWTGMLNALAVFTFATENALFLVYPHHEGAEGLGMMIRAKLTFLGKGAAIAFALALLVAWSVFCKKQLPESWVAPTFVIGAIMATWAIAATALAATAWCWRRFDLNYDVPPE